MSRAIELRTNMYAVSPMNWALLGTSAFFRAMISQKAKITTIETMACSMYLFEPLQPRHPGEEARRHGRSCSTQAPRKPSSGIRLNRPLTGLPPSSLEPRSCQPDLLDLPRTGGSPRTPRTPHRQRCRSAARTSFPGNDHRPNRATRRPAHRRSGRKGRGALVHTGCCFASLRRGLMISGHPLVLHGVRHASSDRVRRSRLDIARWTGPRTRCRRPRFAGGRRRIPRPPTSRRRPPSW